jgi:acyl carrier protein
MDRNQISKIVRDEVATVCRIPADQIEPSTELFDLGLDSISIVELMTRLADRFNSDLSDADFFDRGLCVADFFVSPCVDGIVDMIESKLTGTHE